MAKSKAKVKKVKKAKKIKKAVKKVVKKVAAKKKVKKTTPKTVKTKKLIKKKVVKSPKQAKPIGKVIHFFNHIRVAIVKFNQNVSSGTELYFKGATTDFKEVAKSMQYNHAIIAIAPKGKQIGIKVKKRVREGDLVYKAG